MSFSSLLRNASPCHPLRREKEKKGITMLSESFAMREESPSFLLFPLERRSRHFSKKRKERKDGSIEIRHHGGRRFLSAEERKRKKKKAKERNPPVCRAPVLGKRAKRKGGGLHSLERFFPFAEKGERLQMRNPEEKKRETFSSAQGRISSCLSFRKKKRRKEKHRPFLAAPPFSYVPSSALF